MPLESISYSRLCYINFGIATFVHSGIHSYIFIQISYKAGWSLLSIAAVLIGPSKVWFDRPAFSTWITWHPRMIPFTASFLKGSHYYIRCNSACDGNFSDIMILYATREQIVGVTIHTRLYTCLVYYKKSTDQNTRKARSSVRNKWSRAYFDDPKFWSPSLVEIWGHMSVTTPLAWQLD